MGIKLLNQLLREKCPDAFIDLPYSYFRGKRVAWDCDNILRKLMSRAHKEIVNRTDVCTQELDRNEILRCWLGHVKDEIIKFLKFGITPIFVFDGTYIEAKSDTQDKRRKEKQKRIKEAEECKNKILLLDELERTPQMVTELRKKMQNLGNIQTSEREFCMQLFKACGFPVLQATEEGEKLCAMLCIEGYIDCVYSRDTDLTAMGCPLVFGEEAGWIYNKETKRSEMSVKCVNFKPILSALQMEYPTFLDLCIMSGCDFNSNIYNLGVKKAHKLLLQYKSIDALPAQYDEKKKILNHVQCREIFKRQKSKDICVGDIILDMKYNIDFSELTEKYNKEINVYDVNDWKLELPGYFIDFPKPSQIFLEKAPSLASSRIRLCVVRDNVEREEGKKEDRKNEMKQDIPFTPLPGLNVSGNFEEKLIPKQKVSPKQINNNIISNLNTLQLQRLNKQYNQEKETKMKKLIKLNILS
jgi:5'-3' exonuclease